MFLLSLACLYSRDMQIAVGKCRDIGLRAGLLHSIVKEECKAVFNVYPLVSGTFLSALGRYALEECVRRLL